MAQQTGRFDRGRGATGDARWGELWWFLVVTIACSVATLSFGPLSPFLRDTFGISRAEMGLFATIVQTATSVFAVVVGSIVDVLGIRRCLLLGTVAVGLFFAALAQAHRVEVAYLFAFALGLGNAFLNPAMVKGLVLSFSPRNRATVVGLRQSGVAVGSAIGGAALPALSLALGWQRAVTLVGAIIGVLGLLNIPLLREPPGSNMTRAQPLSVKQTWQVLKSRNIVLLGLVSTGYIAVQVSLLTYLVLYLTEARGFTIQAAGGVLAAVSASGACARVAWGYISDRLFSGQRKPVVLMIGLISLAGTVTVSLFGNTMPVWLVWAGFAIFGFSAVGWNGLVLTYSAEVGPDEMPATAVGAVMTISVIGVLCMPVFGYIVDSTSSYSLAWLFLGFWCAVALVSVTLVRDKKPGPI